MENAEEDFEIVEPAEERVYSYREKALRDFFVKEYLVDYDEVAAAVRCGYPRNVAREFGKRFMNEPYVMREIRRIEGSDVSEDDPDAEKKRIISGLKREANYRGPGSSQSARVAALSKLATLFEMDPKDKKPDETGENELDGAFVVPGVMTPDQWAEAAKKQQEALVDSTITPLGSNNPSIH